MAKVMSLILEIEYIFKDNNNPWWTYSDICKQLWATDVHCSPQSVSRRMQEHPELFNTHMEGKYKKFRLCI